MVTRNPGRDSAEGWQPITCVKTTTTSLMRKRPTCTVQDTHLCAKKNAGRDETSRIYNHSGQRTSWLNITNQIYSSLPIPYIYMYIHGIMSYPPNVFLILNSVSDPEHEKIVHLLTRISYPYHLHTFKHQPGNNTYIYVYIFVTSLCYAPVCYLSVGNSCRR